MACWFFLAKTEKTGRLYYNSSCKGCLAKRKMMEESRFAEETEKVFSEIIDEIEKYDWDFSYDYQGDHLTIFDHGRQYLSLNKNFGRHQLWLVTKREIYHFIFRNKKWRLILNKQLISQAVIRRYLDIVCGKRGQIF